MLTPLQTTIAALNEKLTKMTDDRDIRFKTTADENGTPVLIFNRRIIANAGFTEGQTEAQESFNKFVSDKS